MYNILIQWGGKKSLKKSLKAHNYHGIHVHDHCMYRTTIICETSEILTYKLLAACSSSHQCDQRGKSALKKWQRRKGILWAISVKQRARRCDQRLSIGPSAKKDESYVFNESYVFSECPSYYFSNRYIGAHSLFIKMCFVFCLMLCETLHFIHLLFLACSGIHCTSMSPNMARVIFRSVFLKEALSFGKFVNNIETFHLISK